MVFCRIIVVIMIKPIQKITLKMLFSVPCCNIQQLSKISFQRKVNLKMVFCRIIALITSKRIREITLKMFFSVPCCDSRQIFFCGSPSQHTQLSKLAIRNKLNLELVFCRTINVITLKPIRKITLNMLFSVPCCDSQQIFFLWLSKETHSALKTFNSK